MPPSDPRRPMSSSPIVGRIRDRPSLHELTALEIREELKTQHLTFTEIAKRVGESWQLLVSEEKEHYEMQALSAKEKYHAELIKYKKTDHYREYSEYLADFKAKNATTAGEDFLLHVNITTSCSSEDRSLP